MFSEIITVVILALAPIISKLSTVAPVAQESVLHVCRLGRFGLQVFVDKTQRRGVVGLDWRGRLFVAQFFQQISRRDGLASIDE